MRDASRAARIVTVEDPFEAEVRRFLMHDVGVQTLPGVPLEDRFRSLVEFQSRLNAAGLAVPAWPNRWGGRDLSPADAATISMALGRHGAPELINFVGTDVLAPALFQFARDEDLDRWLPEMASAAEIWCQLFSEPDFGSDLTNLRTRAEPVADGGWRVTGHKVWSTWAQFARWGVLLARTGSVASRHRGISAFVVDMRSPGIFVRPIRTMTGSDEFCEVFLDSLVVSPAALLGEVDGGWTVAQIILNAERGPYASRRAAVIGRWLGEVVEAARRRRPPPALRQEVVRAVISHRLLELRIRELVDGVMQGAEIGAETVLTKMALTDAEQRVCSVALDLLGVGGLSPDACPGLGNDYLYSRAASIYGGTAQIQRNIASERLLGLPRWGGHLDSHPLSEYSSIIMSSHNTEPQRSEGRRRTGWTRRPTLAT